MALNINKLSVYKCIFFCVYSITNMADKPNMTEITTFDKTKLRKTDTQEKNPLPTKESKYLVLKQQLNCLIVKCYLKCVAFCIVCVSNFS